MDTVTWILAIYVLGLAAMVLELFIPGAVIGLTGFAMVIGSIIYAASTGRSLLAGGLIAATLVFLPFFFLLWKNVLGRVFSLPETLKDYRSSAREYDGLMGKEGVAQSALRPSGSAFVEGERYAVVTRGEMIDKGVRVKVIDVSGSRLVVKRATAREEGEEAVEADGGAGSGH